MKFRAAFFFHFVVITATEQPVEAPEETCVLQKTRRGQISQSMVMEEPEVEEAGAPGTGEESEAFEKLTEEAAHNDAPTESTNRIAAENSKSDSPVFIAQDRHVAHFDHLGVAQWLRSGWALVGQWLGSWFDHIGADQLKLNVMMLALNTELSQKRVRTFQKSLHKNWPEFEDLVEYHSGVNWHDMSDEGWADLHAETWNIHDGSRACALGHLQIWRKAAARDGWTVVLEDDAQIIMPITKSWFFEHVVHKVESMAVRNPAIHEFVWLEARPCKWGFGTAAYAISQKEAVRLLEAVNGTFNKVVDLWLVQTYLNDATDPESRTALCPVQMPMRQGNMGDTGKAKKGYISNMNLVHLGHR